MKRIPSFFRGIAWALVLSFCLEPLAQAAPEFPTAQAIHFSLSPSLNIPSSVARVRDSFDAHTSKKIFLIEDAHANPSGQLNLAQSLEHLFKDDPSLSMVFIEAGRGDNSLTPLRAYGDTDFRRRTAMRYIRSGELHGEEFYNLISPKPFTIWGVEDLKLYGQSVEDYRRVAQKREGLQAYLASIGSTMDALKKRLAGAELTSVLDARQLYHREEMDFTAYAATLLNAALFENISLTDYPALQKLSHIRGEEARLDFKAASREQVAAIARLPKEDQEMLSQRAQKASAPSGFRPDDSAQEGFFALLEEKLTRSVIPAQAGIQENGSMPASAGMTNLKKYFAYRKHARAVDSEKILEETHRLEEVLVKQLAQTDDERKLVHAWEAQEFWAKLFDLTLTPEEFETGRAFLDPAVIREVTGFLNRKIVDLETLYERALFLEPDFEKTLAVAKDFYELTAKRDEYFLIEALRKMEETSQTRAVLVAGGFHTPNLKKLLREKKISYVCLTPQVLAETNHTRYESILLGQPVVSGSPTQAKTSTNRPMAAELVYEMGGKGVYAKLLNDFQVVPASGARLAETSTPDKKKNPREYLLTKVHPTKKNHNDYKPSSRWDQPLFKKVFLTDFLNSVRQYRRTEEWRWATGFSKADFIDPEDGGLWGVLEENGYFHSSKFFDFLNLWRLSRRAHLAKDIAEDMLEEFEMGGIETEGLKLKLSGNLMMRVARKILPVTAEHISLYALMAGVVSLIASLVEHWAYLHTYYFEIALSIVVTVLLVVRIGKGVEWVEETFHRRLNQRLSRNFINEVTPEKEREKAAEFEASFRMLASKFKESRDRQILKALRRALESGFEPVKRADLAKMGADLIRWSDTNQVTVSAQDVAITVLTEAALRKRVAFHPDAVDQEPVLAKKILSSKLLRPFILAIFPQLSEWHFWEKTSSLPHLLERFDQINQNRAKAKQSYNDDVQVRIFDTIYHGENGLDENGLSRSMVLSYFSGAILRAGRIERIIESDPHKRLHAKIEYVIRIYSILTELREKLERLYQNHETPDLGLKDDETLKMIAELSSRLERMEKGVSGLREEYEAQQGKNGARLAKEARLPKGIFIPGKKESWPGYLTEKWFGHPAFNREVKVTEVKFYAPRRLLNVSVNVMGHDAELEINFKSREAKVTEFGFNLPDKSPRDKYGKLIFVSVAHWLHSKGFRVLEMPIVRTGSGSYFRAFLSSIKKRGRGDAFKIIEEDDEPGEGEIIVYLDRLDWAEFLSRSQAPAQGARLANYSGEPRRAFGGLGHRQKNLIVAVFAVTSVALAVFLGTGYPALVMAHLGHLPEALPWIVWARNAGMLAMVGAAAALGIIAHPNRFPIQDRLRLALSVLAASTISFFAFWRNEGKFDFHTPHLHDPHHFFGPSTWAFEFLNQYSPPLGSWLYAFEYSGWNDGLLGVAIVSVLFMLFSARLAHQHFDQHPVNLFEVETSSFRASTALADSMKLARVVMMVGLFWTSFSAWMEEVGIFKSAFFSSEWDLVWEEAGFVAGYWMAKILTAHAEDERVPRSTFWIDFVAAGLVSVAYTMTVGLLTDWLTDAIAISLFTAVPDELRVRRFTLLQQYLRPVELILIGLATRKGLNYFRRPDERVTLNIQGPRSGEGARLAVPPQRLRLAEVLLDQFADGPFTLGEVQKALSVETPQNQAVWRSTQIGFWIFVLKGSLLEEESHFSSGSRRFTLLPWAQKLASDPLFRKDLINAINYPMTQTVVYELKKLSERWTPTDAAGARLVQSPAEFAHAIGLNPDLLPNNVSFVEDRGQLPNLQNQLRRVFAVRLKDPTQAISPITIKFSPAITIDQYLLIQTHELLHLVWILLSDDQRREFYNLYTHLIRTDENRWHFKGRNNWIALNYPYEKIRMDIERQIDLSEAFAHEGRRALDKTAPLLFQQYFRKINFFQSGARLSARVDDLYKRDLKGLIEAAKQSAEPVLALDALWESYQAKNLRSEDVELLEPWEKGRYNALFEAEAQLFLKKSVITSNHSNAPELTETKTYLASKLAELAKSNPVDLLILKYGIGRKATQIADILKNNPHLEARTFQAFKFSRPVDYVTLRGNSASLNLLLSIIVFRRSGSYRVLRSKAYMDELVRYVENYEPAGARMAEKGGARSEVAWRMDQIRSAVGKSFFNLALESLYEAQGIVETYYQEGLLSEEDWLNFYSRGIGLIHRIGDADRYSRDKEFAGSVIDHRTTEPHSRLTLAQIYHDLAEYVKAHQVLVAIQNENHTYKENDAYQKAVNGLLREVERDLRKKPLRYYGVGSVFVPAPSLKPSKEKGIRLNLRHRTTAATGQYRGDTSKAVLDQAQFDWDGKNVTLQMEQNFFKELHDRETPSFYYDLMVDGKSAGFMMINFKSWNFEPGPEIRLSISNNPKLKKSLDVWFSENSPVSTAGARMATGIKSRRREPQQLSFDFEARERFLAELKGLRREKLLKALRLASGLEQGRFGAQAHISRVESDLKNPSQRLILEMSEAMEKVFLKETPTRLDPGEAREFLRAAYEFSERATREQMLQEMDQLSKAGDFGQLVKCLRRQRHLSLVSIGSQYWLEELKPHASEAVAGRVIMALTLDYKNDDRVNGIEAKAALELARQVAGARMAENNSDRYSGEQVLTALQGRFGEALPDLLRFIRLSEKDFVSQMGVMAIRHLPHDKESASVDRFVIRTPGHRARTFFVKRVIKTEREDVGDPSAYLKRQETIGKKVHALGLGANLQLLQNGEPMLVTERLLGRILKDPTDDPVTVRAIGVALGRLHRAGILHGDARPEHAFIRLLLMRNGQNRAKVSFIDFGSSADMEQLIRSGQRTQQEMDVHVEIEKKVFIGYLVKETAEAFFHEGYQEGHGSSGARLASTTSNALIRQKPVFPETSYATVFKRNRGKFGYLYEARIILNHNVSTLPGRLRAFIMAFPVTSRRLGYNLHGNIVRFPDPNELNGRLERVLGYAPSFKFVRTEAYLTEAQYAAQMADGQIPINAGSSYLDYFDDHFVHAPMRAWMMTVFSDEVMRSYLSSLQSSRDDRSQKLQFSVKSSHSAEVDLSDVFLEWSRQQNLEKRESVLSRINGVLTSRILGDVPGTQYLDDSIRRRFESEQAQTNQAHRGARLAEETTSEVPLQEKISAFIRGLAQPFSIQLARAEGARLAVDMGEATTTFRVRKDGVRLTAVDEAGVLTPVEVQLNSHRTLSGGEALVSRSTSNASQRDSVRSDTKEQTSQTGREVAKRIRDARADLADTRKISVPKDVVFHVGLFKGLDNQAFKDQVDLMIDQMKALYKGSTDTRLVFGEISEAAEAQQAYLHEKVLENTGFVFDQVEAGRIEVRVGYGPNHRNVSEGVIYVDAEPATAERSVEWADAWAVIQLTAFSLRALADKTTGRMDWTQEGVRVDAQKSLASEKRLALLFGNGYSVKGYLGHVSGAHFVETYLLRLSDLILRGAMELALLRRMIAQAA